jgi:GntR family transcriptional regulator/MocR family aminotransferase
MGRQTELPLTLHRAGSGPLHLQLAEQFRAAVRDGRLRAGHRLPSTRELARQLSVSRSVAQAAYDQLHAEGWIAGRTGSGTYVADVVPLRPAVRRTAKPAKPESEPSEPEQSLSLRPGIPYVGLKPDAGWRRAWREVSAQPPAAGYDEAAGLQALRVALAEYVGRVRGIACGPENLLVTNGTTHGLRLYLAVTRQPGDRIAIEDPGYHNAVAAARDRGLRITDAPVDADGLRVDTLSRGLSAVYVTPSHQYPLGGRLPVARRNALVSWARETRATVIEDDYDSEFRYDVAPLPALAQLDLDRVVHLGTLSKTLSPALRLGWLVGAAPVVDELTAYREQLGDWPAWPMQAALLAMLRDGYLDQAVRRGRRLYANRRNLVCDALAPYGEIIGQEAGLHITLLLPEGWDDREVADCALAAGLIVAPLSEYRRSNPGSPGLVIGYARPLDADFGRALEVLVETLRAN